MLDRNPPLIRRKSTNYLGLAVQKKDQLEELPLEVAELELVVRVEVAVLDQQVGPLDHEP